MNLFILLIALANATTSTFQVNNPPLLPEVQAILDVKPLDEKEPDQNAYVYLMGIDIDDDNYHAIAKKNY